MPRETKKPQTQQTEELPELSPNEFDFVQAVLKGNTGSDAYRHAYSVENMSDAAIWVEASRVKARPNVSLWLSEARRQGMAQTVVTLETHTAELDRLSVLAEKAGAFGASIKAQELRGRANGLYVDQIKTDTGQADVLQALAIIGKTDPAFAKAMKDQLGLSESDTEGSDGTQTETTH